MEIYCVPPDPWNFQEGKKNLVKQNSHGNWVPYHMLDSELAQKEYENKEKAQM